MAAPLVSQLGMMAGQEVANWGWNQLSNRDSGFRNTFRRWTGLGDYNINYNSLIQGTDNSGKRVQLSSMQERGGMIVVKYREYVGDVVTHPTIIGAFNNTSYIVNPGNPTLFPWLSPVAQSFEQYTPLGIIFEFIGTATDSITTNASIGSVIMASEYDTSDTPFRSKMQMLSSAYSQEARLSDTASHGIECDPNTLPTNVFYTRVSDANIDGKDYDVCRFNIATVGGGLAANQSVGSLYIHYEFAFMKEQLFWGPTFEGGDLHQFNSFYTGIVYNANIDWASAALRGGMDLGVRYVGTGGTGTITVPKKWAGWTFRFRFWHYNPTAVAAGATSVALTTGWDLTLRPLLEQGFTGVWGGANFTIIATSAQGIAVPSTALTLVAKLADATATDAVMTVTGPWGSPGTYSGGVFFTFDTQPIANTHYSAVNTS